MGKIKNPTSFTMQFGISVKVLENEGIFDPILNVDTKLFIDPLLLPRSKKKLISSDAHAAYVKHFESVVKLLKKSKSENDVAWKAAWQQLNIREAPGTSLGYGVGSTSGRNIQKELVNKLVRTAKEIVDIGIEDPELFSLLPLIEDGIGPDLISDFTTFIIERQLLDFTADFARRHSLPLTQIEHRLGQVDCLLNPLLGIPILLLPIDILAKLPTASDWSEVQDAAAFNETLRGRVNRFVAEVWTKQAKKDKKELRRRLLSDRKTIEEAISFIGQLRAKPYDFKSDEKGLVFWHEWLKRASEDYPLKIEGIKSDKSGLVRVVQSVIDQFRFLVEKHGLNKLLWHGARPAPEKVSQLLFLAISYSYCRANDIDISPEMDAGTGLIDFKFSKGFTRRAIVEIKLSTSAKLVQGYSTQLQIYKESEETELGYYVVIHLGNETKKTADLEKMRDDKFSKIETVDGRKRLSASKVKGKPS